MNADDWRVVRRTAQIEAQLRAEGVDPMLIPGIIGAAFMGSLTNLPPRQRIRVIQAHLAAVREVMAGALKGETQ
jgi:hypothetical protein